MRDEPCADAVVNKKFGLIPSKIVNLSLMAPKLQELYSISSKLPELRVAIAKSDGALELSTHLDVPLKMEVKHLVKPGRRILRR